MNVFRLVGDMSHLLAIIILLYNIWKTGSCSGISGKSQILFGLVHITRYLDLFTNYVSVYNSVMKIVFIGTSLATIYLIYLKFGETYERKHDSLRFEILVISVATLALVVNHEFTPFEVLWTFSIYLESIAILPQFFMVFKIGQAESITFLYLFCLGSYRALYILNWVYRYHTEGYYDIIAIVAGIVQTVLYCEFFCLYYAKGTSEVKKETLDKNLPISSIADDSFGSKEFWVVAFDDGFEVDRFKLLEKNEHGTSFTNWFIQHAKGKSEFDWQKETEINYEYPIKNQGICESYYTPVPMLESSLPIKLNNSHQMQNSPQDNFSCSIYNQAPDTVISISTESEGVNSFPSDSSGEKNSGSVTSSINSTQQLNVSEENNMLETRIALFPESKEDFGLKSSTPGVHKSIN